MLTAAAVDDLVGWSVLAVALGVLASSTAWDYVRILGESALFIVLTVSVVRPLLRYLLRSASPLARSLPFRGIRGRVRDRGDRHPCGVRGVPRRRRDAAPAHGGLAALEAESRADRPILAPIYFVTSGMAVDIPGLRASDLADSPSSCGRVRRQVCPRRFAGARVAGIAVRESAAVGILMNTRGLMRSCC